MTFFFNGFPVKIPILRSGKSLSKHRTHSRADDTASHWVWSLLVNGEDSEKSSLHSVLLLTAWSPRTVLLLPWRQRFSRKSSWIRLLDLVLPEKRLQFLYCPRLPFFYEETFLGQFLTSRRPSHAEFFFIPRTILFYSAHDFFCHPHMQCFGSLWREKNSSSSPPKLRKLRKMSIDEQFEDFEANSTWQKLFLVKNEFFFRFFSLSRLRRCRP